MTKIIAIAMLALACSAIPFAPSEDHCLTLTLNPPDGSFDQWGDWREESFMVQWIIDPRVVASLENGRLVFQTDSISFQWERQIDIVDVYTDVFFSFKGLNISAGAIRELYFVGDDFDTLKVTNVDIVDGKLIVPSDTLFRDTTQMHVWGFVADSFAVDNFQNCYHTSNP